MTLVNVRNQRRQEGELITCMLNLIRFDFYIKLSQRIKFLHVCIFILSFNDMKIWELNLENNAKNFMNRGLTFERHYFSKAFLFV